MCAGTLIKVDY